MGDNKNRKIGRCKKSAQNLAYKGERRHVKSHIRRIKAAIIGLKHLNEDHPEQRRLQNKLREYELQL